MKLWLLEPIDKHDSPFGCFYDVYDGFVVRAETEQQARKIACDAADREEKWRAQSPWLNPEHTTCDEVLVDGEPGVVMSSFSRA